jgi:hypothetical protein
MCVHIQIAGNMHGAWDHVDVSTHTCADHVCTNRPIATHVLECPNYMSACGTTQTCIVSTIKPLRHLPGVAWSSYVRTYGGRPQIRSPPTVILPEPTFWCPGLPTQALCTSWLPAFFR